MPGITVQLIDALLNPSQDRSAETHYQAIVLPSRVLGLFSLLLESKFQTLENIDGNDVARCLLTCVLLRRDISCLGGYAIQKPHQSTEIVQMLASVVKPLLECLGASTNNDNRAAASIKRQIRFVLAEVCSILSLMDETKAREAVNSILSSIMGTCHMAHVPSLELLSSIAQEAPFVIPITEVMPILSNATKGLSTSTGNPQSPSSQFQSQQLQATHAILETMTSVSIASTLQQHPKTVTSGGDSRERLVQMIHFQTMAKTNSPMLNIDENSSAAMMGKVCTVPLLQLVQRYSCGNHTPEIKGIYQTLSHAASKCPSLLAGDVSTLHHFCRVLLSVASNFSSAEYGSAAGLDNDDDEKKYTCLAAMEALVALFGVPDVKMMVGANDSIRSLCIVGDETNGITGVVKSCAAMIVNGVDDDIEAWATGELGLLTVQATEEWEDDDVAIFAESIFERFVRNVGGGPQCLEMVLGAVETLLAPVGGNDVSSFDRWKRVRGAISMMEICLEAFPHSFIPHAPVALEAALNFTSDPCVRVQFQSVQLLGSLCQASIIGMREQHGQRILGVIVKLLSSKCGKVVSHACMAITSYCMGENDTSIDKGLVTPFLRDILEGIRSGPLSLDVSSNVGIYCRAFGAIASLADTVHEEFAAYYQNIMPGLLDCSYYGLERDGNDNITGKGSSSFESISVRDAAIMTASIVGSSVCEVDGLFQPDAEKLMGIILPLLQASSIDQNTSLISKDRLLAATAQISVAVKAAFAPFLPTVLPHLLKVAKEEVDVSISEGDNSAVGKESEFDEDTGMETMTFALPGMGVKKLVLNTTQMHEKSQTAKSLYELARSMGASFGPYSKECMEAFVPLLQFKYSEIVRTSAALAVGAIFESSCEYAVSPECNPAYRGAPNNYFAMTLINVAKQIQLEEDDDKESLCILSEVMSNMAYCAYDSKNESDVPVALLTAEEAKIFVSECITIIQSSLTRRGKLISFLTVGKLDDDQKVEYDETLEREIEFMIGIVDSIGYTLKSMKDTFLPIFDAIVAPFFGPLLRSSGNADVKARFAAICLFDDCVEHCGHSAAVKYSPMLADAVSEGINDEDIQVREASVYGIAQIARRCPSSLNSHANSFVQHSAAVAKEGIAMPKEDILNIRLVENSASALATMTLFPNSPFQQSSVPRADIVNIFLSNLPLEQDFDEAKICHEGLCGLVESGEVDMSANVDRLMQIIGEIVSAVNDGDEMASHETCGRFAGILAEMQTRVDQNLMQQAYSKLSEEARNGVNLLMGS